MVTLTDAKWKLRLSKIDYAFQPIVNIHTGNAFGFEALLRNHREAGFNSIEDIFDQAWEENVLHQVDLELRKKAMKKFSLFKKGRRTKLFFNLDNRLLDSRDYAAGSTSAILKQYGYSLDDVCFEISEKHKVPDSSAVLQTLAAYRSQGFKIAVDDCGAGFSGFQLLYFTEPDYIKIDRFFIQHMENDPIKRLMVSTIVNMAHFMGSLVMAEGVETIGEFNSCRAMGCDMVQGYFVQRPCLELTKLKLQYMNIECLTKNDLRDNSAKDQGLIRNKMEYIKPVSSKDNIIAIFDKFKGVGNSFFPVINCYEEPIGIIRENSFKDFIFSKFGRQLLENPAFGKDINRFITRIPIADIHSSVEKLIERYSQLNCEEGILIVDNLKYIGFISPQSLLKIINEKKLTIARNQNPLTKLPGNTLIHEYFSRALSDMDFTYYLVYFDFDNFKPYNDTYGFRNGDRLIQMFADMLKSAELPENRFAGHVGGDDFFLGIKGGSRNEVLREMKTIARQFKTNAESFYDPEALKKGYIFAKDREGIEREIPLTTVSTAILELPARVERLCSIEEAGNIIFKMKKKAKASPTKFCLADIMYYLQPVEAEIFHEYPVNIKKLCAER